jgi:methylenetetrahydrofolate dehydrogenase (NADP+)/methenyltetrahydrofolate cyclohydrolase
MSAHIIDGKQIASEIRREVQSEVAVFRERVGRAPGLHVVLVGEDPASHVYVRNKERASLEVGMEGYVHRLQQSTTQEELVALVRELNDNEQVDGILIQLPLPAHLDADAVLRILDPRKDVDGLHPYNVGMLVMNKPALRPCTPSGCMELLRRIDYAVEGKHAVVVGRSMLVGKPIASMLLQQSATVTIAHSRTEDLRAHVMRADVLVAAVGKPELIAGEWIKPGAVVLDVGINRLPGGALVGDVHFASAKERASWITPVPGGVGAMTIAMLLKNTLWAARQDMR